MEYKFAKLNFCRQSYEIAVETMRARMPDHRPSSADHTDWMPVVVIDTNKPDGVIIRMTSVDQQIMAFNHLKLAFG